MLSCDCGYEYIYEFAEEEEVKHHTWQDECDHCGCSILGKSGLIVHTVWAEGHKEEWEDDHCIGWNEEEDEQLYDEEMPDPPMFFLCEGCGDLYESIKEKGFCTISVETMQEDLVEWNAQQALRKDKKHKSWNYSQNIAADYGIPLRPVLKPLGVLDNGSLKFIRGKK